MSRVGLAGRLHRLQLQCRGSSAELPSSNSRLCLRGQLLRCLPPLFVDFLDGVMGETSRDTAPVGGVELKGGDSSLVTPDV